ncbi:hypothetical protein BT96DRAFT_947884 [Gymnopus androsaceus JB14]|uniref:Myb/SANT-like domain-containing protein n=1 Tax=Gymnopus androsaceus JB14 TaxID=1447944 RepID=A0A6A4GSA0_9AGAR|nr:hypothetical protein BT96DRAFT_947884 [Gymnopus androsaceus JB14]
MTCHLDRANWDSTAEAILVEGLKKAVRAGQKSDNNFKPQVYHSISLELRQKGYKLDHKQVKSWWTRFKGSHKIVDFLLHECSGFGWDDTTKCVTAIESVWHNLLYDKDGNKQKHHNDYKHFQNHSFPLYDDITDIIGGTKASSTFAYSSVSTSTPPMENGPAAAAGDEQIPAAEPV